ncbi:MAG: hypothetical protein CVT49_12800 [candidate division Zixibacteria bacterium HGW-Zixibacteria-1]|nr:MAG: hypothetical protein CVT49_12800 [candidate division Zixibacteria bacterium HGW-Zixibacteria-1]
MHKTLIFSVLLVILCGLSVSGQQAPRRLPAVADMFYPADAAKLHQMVDQHLASVGAQSEIDGKLIALVVPHAGLIYSGQIAAYAYKLLENSGVNKVILCGPSHKYGFDGISVYAPGGSWSMPFGDVRINREMASKLISFSDKINFIPEAQDREHCLEVQLPYLQTVMSDFTMVPIIMGNQSKENIKLLADALKSLEFDSQTVIISSTDWQHYKPASIGKKFDSTGLVCFENLDPVRLEMALADGSVEMCGGGPAVAVMKAAIAKGANKAKILKYGDSGDISGDKSSVVGYAAIALYKSNDNGSKLLGKDKKKELPSTLELTDEDRQILLQIARKTLENYLSGGSTPEFELTDNLKKFGAAFVTLEKDGRLRGCIGHTTAVEPLYKTVSDCAIQAAVADPRFPSVDRAELDKLHIEISVLSPMQKIESLEDIVVGRDGLMIFKGQSRGLLLPQVATDYGWDRTTFLEQTCQKAGLPTDAYKSPDATIFRFQANVFGE